MAEKKLSIIVPIYNVGLYLRECVESLLGQTYSNVEIILVDDGSLDNSGVLCDKFALNNPSIKVIHQENKGLPYARNAGLKIATGEYIGFIDSDDYISKDMYKTMIEHIENTQSGLAICNFQTFNKAGNNPIQERYKNEVIFFNESNALRFYQCSLDSSWNKVYLRNIIKKNEIMFEDKSIVAQEDFWFLVKYCSHISKIVTIAEPYYHYRERKTSISKSRSDKDIVSRCLHFVDIASDYIRNNHREIDSFREYLLMNLMFASINNIPEPCAKKIYDVVMSFKTCDCFDNAVSKKLKMMNKNIKDLRGFYDFLLYYMLDRKLYRLFSALETMRVKRLQSKKKTEIYFN